MNLLLDTNVFIDYVGRKPSFFADAERVVAAGYFGDAKLWVSVQSLKDAFYVLERYLDSRKIQRAFLNACEVITPVGLSADDALRAARLEWDDYKDCLIALCAEKARADYLITRDTKGFARSSVPAMTPAEWLGMMRRERRLVYDVVDWNDLEEDAR